MERITEVENVFGAADIFTAPSVGLKRFIDGMLLSPLTHPRG